MANEAPVITHFKRFYRDLQASDISELGLMYEKDVCFRDPIHEIRGLVPLEDYFNDLCAELTECRFEYLDQLVTDNVAYIKWIMHFRHPKLGKKRISVRGITHLKFADKIDFHEDLYDLGAMLYEQIPVVGNVTRWLRQRMAS